MAAKTSVLGVETAKVRLFIFLMCRTIERIYPYYVKAPSDSNSKPIKQLLSGKNEKPFQNCENLSVFSFRSLPSGSLTLNYQSHKASAFSCQGEPVTHLQAMFFPCFSLTEPYPCFMTWLN